MKRTFFLACIAMVFSIATPAQSAKSTEHIEQLWFGYFTQTRFSNKWGLWTDLHLRTKENFTNNFSQTLLRAAIIYYLSDNTRLMAGYVRAYHYPGDNHKEITQPENRFWQQVQWNTAFTKTRITQAIRLEERYRQKILNDSALATGYNFNWRLRYNFWYEVPLLKNGVIPKSISFIINDEIHINFGKEIVYNYFDQNRFFLGLKYQFSKSSNIQAGYLNIFQQLAAGNKYKNINGVRVFFYQTFDLRKK